MVRLESRPNWQTRMSLQARSLHLEFVHFLFQFRCLLETTWLVYSPHGGGEFLAQGEAEAPRRRSVTLG